MPDMIKDFGDLKRDYSTFTDGFQGREPNMNSTSKKITSRFLQAKTILLVRKEFVGFEKRE